MGGNITGTGNQIDYFVAEVRSFTGSKQAVRDFYFRQNVISPLDGTSQKPTVVMIDDDGIDAQVFFWAQGINEWNLMREEDATRYVVYIYDGESSGLDLRGY